MKYAFPLLKQKCSNKTLILVHFVWITRSKNKIVPKSDYWCTNIIENIIFVLLKLHSMDDFKVTNQPKRATVVKKQKFQSEWTRTINET